MHRRVVVSPSCATPCPSCVSCRPSDDVPSLDDVLGAGESSELFLGGGDATRWPHLAALLAENLARPEPRKIWIEAPASSLGPNVLADLARRGAYGVRVQLESVGARAGKLLGAPDGARVVLLAERAGLAVETRICVRPKTFPMLPTLARQLAPRTAWLEIVRQDWGREPVPMPAPVIDEVMHQTPNLRFSAHRLAASGYLPPCALPKTWIRRPDAWRATFRDRQEPNRALPICDRCALRTTCQWDDAGALSAEARDAAKPIARPRERRRATELAVPDVIVRRRPATPVACVTPWTTMEVVDPDGRVRQCCSTWTHGDRGSVLGASLEAVWNGAGYRDARRAMASGSLGTLCQPICSRLHDLKFSEERFKIQSGTEPFMKNQLLMAEEIAERKEELRSLPLRIALCPSTYCNYNCIMCDHGRSPRRELPESIWEELPRYLPTLQSLTLLGGEPLANPHTWKFLRAFDQAKYPDASVDLVTNGSLLTESALKQIRTCALGDVTLSMNAGTAEAYERVQRGEPWPKVLANLDALLRFRDERPFWFGITLGFVVQPAAAHTLMEFGALAHERNLRIRLMALNPENHEGLDFYADVDAVNAVLEHVDRFAEWAERVRPEWLSEIRASRSAVLEEARRRQALLGSSLVTLRRRDAARSGTP